MQRWRYNYSIDFLKIRIKHLKFALRFTQTPAYNGHQVNWYRRPNIGRRVARLQAEQWGGESRPKVELWIGIHAFCYIMYGYDSEGYVILR